MLPLVISPSEKLRNQSHNLEVRPVDVQRHSDALNVQRNYVQNKFSLTEDTEVCKTENI